MNYATWRCDGLAPPEGVSNAGSVPFLLTDNIKSVQAKIIDAVAAAYKVEKDDVVLLA